MEQKRKVAESLKKLDEAYPAGLVEYFRRAKALLAASREGLNPMEGWVAQVPTEFEVLDSVGSKAFAALEKRGKNGLLR